MHTQDAIRSTFGISHMVLGAYFSDLSDAELLHRPGAGCNHLAWQLGHLIASECSLLEMICPGAAIKLPDGFAERHSKDAKDVDDPSKFESKATYAALLEQVKNASLDALGKLSDSELDKPGPEMFASMCPTVGSMFVLIATHPLMHAGQFVPVRRALGKPVVI